MNFSLLPLTEPQSYAVSMCRMSAYFCLLYY